jgi:hypothetical protein
MTGSDGSLSAAALAKVLIPAVVGAAIALIAPILTSWLTLKRERRQQLWQRELQRFFELEELAGILTEALAGHGPLDQMADQLHSQMAQLKIATGKFRRYPQVAQAIRDFENSAGWILSRERRFDSRAEHDKVMKELESHYQALLKACDKVVGRPW